MEEEKKEIAWIESEMLRKGEETYQEVKTCLDKLTVNINDKERAVKQAVVVQGIVVNKRLEEYFDVLNSEGTKKMTDAWKIAEEYANVFGLCKETVQAAENVVKEKDRSDYINNIRRAMTKKEMSEVIKEVIASIQKDIERIKEKIRLEDDDIWMFITAPLQCHL